MISSLPTTFLSEVSAGDHAISQNTLAYLQERTKSRLYDYVLKKFLEEEKNGLTRAALARRINRSPEVVTRLLGAPGNWTIETLSDLLAGISSEELAPASVSLIDRPRRNYPGAHYKEPRRESFAETHTTVQMLSPVTASTSAAAMLNLSVSTKP